MMKNTKRIVMIIFDVLMTVIAFSLSVSAEDNLLDYLLRIEVNDSCGNISAAKIYANTVFHFSPFRRTATF